MDNVTFRKAARQRGRYVWYSRIPFVIFAGLGAVAIIFMKQIGFDQFWVTAAACGLILTYAVVVWAIPVLRIREDQLGDNSYYLGFLYTLISLCWALYEFGNKGGVEDIVSNFGIALGSTIVGIVMRVFLNQARRDVLEIERDARIELSQAASRMREDIEDATLALRSFCQTTQQMASEQINAAARGAAGALAELTDHAAQLNHSSSRTVKAVEKLVERIDGIDAPRDLLSRRLEPTLAAAEALAARISERMRQDEGVLQALTDRSRELHQELAQTVAAARDSSAQFAATGGIAQQLAETGRRAAAAMLEMSRKAEGALSSQSRIAAALEEGSETLLPALRTYNEKIEAELDRSHRNVGRTSEALVGLAEKITRELA